MKVLTQEEKQEICNEYQSGMTIIELYKKHKIGDKRVRQILVEYGVPINNSHKKTVSTDNYIEKVTERFTPRDGYKFIAIAKDNNTIQYDDCMNKSGTLTAYIKNVLGVEIPSLFKRKKYFHEHGMQWYEQYFDIIEAIDQSVPTKKCPYCSWETVDVNNKSGVFETHLSREHGITKLQYLEEHPEDRDYFTLVNKTLDRKMETDESKFVTCAICGEKFARLDWRHLAKHGITKYEYIAKYSHLTVSENLHDRMSVLAIEANKNMKPVFVSKPEIEIGEYIKSFGVECESGNRNILNGKELDIYIPSLNFAIEYNGNFWHNDKVVDKDKHLKKTEECKKKGVKLLQIFEDEYFNHREIVFNKIKHIVSIDKTLPKVAARKCEIRVIDGDVAKEFLDMYHIQGYVGSTIYLGAFWCNELVAVMTFKQEGKESGKWELTRFASNYNYICQGVGGKLFKYFVRNYQPEEVKSFADRRWTVDEKSNIYVKLGFKFDSYTKPDYSYYCPKIDRYKRFHKFNFRKQLLNKKYGLPLTMTESEMADAIGAKKIWNCGLIKYVWKRW